MGDREQHLVDEKSSSKAAPDRDLDFLSNVVLDISFELGQAEITIGQLLRLREGSIIPLTKQASESLDIRVNGKLLGQADAVVVNEHYGLRVTSIRSPEVVGWEREGE